METKKERAYWNYFLKQFKGNRFAFFSFNFLIFLVLIASLGDFLANDKPLVVRNNGQYYFPVFKSYLVDMGLASWQDDFVNLDWKQNEFQFSVWPLIPYSPTEQNLSSNREIGPFSKQDVKSIRWHHWLGTDKLGRDILSGLIHGTRYALTIGLLSMGIAAIIGVFFGSIAGYFGDDKIKIKLISLIIYPIVLFISCFWIFISRSHELTDALKGSKWDFLSELMISITIFLLMIIIAKGIIIIFKKNKLMSMQINAPLDISISRLIELVITIPVLFLIISLMAVSNPSLYLVMLIIGFTQWTGIARFIRAEILRVKQLDYIEAANALGYSNFRIIIKHVIPNSLTPVFISISFGIASAILIEATLSFLGLSPTDIVTWGSMLKGAREFSAPWWLAMFPGLAIFMTVTVFNLIGEGLTDALDPKFNKGS